MAAGTGIYIPVAMLGDNAAGADTVLRGDQSWGAVPYATLPSARGFSARRDANPLTLTTSAWTTLTYDVEERDDDAAFNPATGEFTVPRNDWFLFTANDQATGIDAVESVILALHVDGTLTRRGDRLFSPASGLNINSSFAAIMYCTAAQVVTMRIWHDEGADAAQKLDTGVNWFSGVALR